ncbi:MAG: hypothetical protein ACD_44C00337G0006 [uncultured bacterium]|nr:MAG: hypothetical protein ACD_44C00337G0006 [uncultured bacterium]
MKRNHSLKVSPPLAKETKIISLKSKDFDSFFKKARRKSSTVAVFYIKTNALQHPRLGMIVKKSYIKSAVKRNKIKRIIREQFRTRIKKWVGYDLIVFVNKPKNKEAMDSFKTDLEKQWLHLENLHR